MFDSDLKHEMFLRDDETILENWETLKHIETKYGLHLEVLLFAIDYIRENPKITFSDAINYALAEWIK